MRLVEIADVSAKPRHYFVRYEERFAPFRDRPVSLLKLGIDNDGSLPRWRDCFPKGVIAGLDTGTSPIDDPGERVSIFRGRQQDTELLDRIGKTVAPEGFDIIIDDACHVGAPTKASFWHLFEHHLKPGGVYAIEDWRSAYWDRWPDGAKYRPDPSLLEKAVERLVYRKPVFRSHQFGLAGFVKQLIDELAVDMITHPARGWSGERSYPRFKKIEFLPGQVFVTKATAEDTEMLKG